MGLQKYRADKSGKTQPNGAVPFYAVWAGGPTLALLRNCPLEGMPVPPRTVYVTGEPDSFFSIPAACTYRKRTYRGYITTDDTGQYVFRLFDSEKDTLAFRGIFGSATCTR